MSAPATRGAAGKPPMTEPNPHDASARSASGLAALPAHGPPRWQDYLPAEDQPCSPDFVFRLVQLDIECRLRAGRPALLAEPYFEHPRLRRPDTTLDALRRAELVRWEYRLRWQLGQRPRRQDYLDRFPQLADTLGALLPTASCPRCGLAEVTLVDEAARGATCPGCGATIPVEELFPTWPQPSTVREGEARVDALRPMTEGGPTRLGRYEVLEEIAQGGMGTIWRVRDPQLGRELAVKVLRSDLRDQPDMVRRFVEESQITAQLPHPGIVPVHELDWDADGSPFLAMKLVRGRTLEELLRARPSPQEDLPRLVAVFEQVCQAVAFAHEHRVIHRDLKPSNIMVGRFGEVQVMDWGLAKVLPPAGRGPQPPGQRRPPPEAVSEVQTGRSGSSEALTQGAVGTWAYMPPEQAHGDADRVDERSDVFSLGGILCAILTGRPPYTGGRNETRDKARRADLADARAALDSCGADAGLVSLTRDCLAAAPDRRPPDAREVARRVAEYQRGVQERLRQAERERAAAETRAQEERKRKRLAVLLAAVVVAALALGGGAVAWYRQDRTRSQAEAAARRERAEDRADAAWHEAEAYLRQNRELQDRDPQRWDAAVRLAAAAVGRAEVALTGTDVAADLEDRVQRMRAEVEREGHDSALRLELDRIRLERAGTREGHYDRDTAVRRYREVLPRHGIDPADAAAAARVVRISRLRGELVAALADWARWDSRADEREQLTALLDAVEGQDGGGRTWRARWRAAVRAKDGSALAALARRPGEELAAADVDNLAGDLMALGQMVAAERLLRRGRERFPDDFWINHDLASVLQQLDRWAESVPYLMVAAAVHPQSAGIHNNLGNALHVQGDLDGAIRCFKKALDLDPNLPIAEHNLGNVLKDKGDTDGAVRCYKRTLEIDPGFAPAHNSLGRIQRDRGELDAAVQSFQLAIRLAPKMAKAHYNLGVTLADRGNVEGAFRCYRKALELDPKDPQVHNNLGVLLANRGDMDGAIPYFRRSIDLDPKGVLAYYNLGEALLAKGDVAGALRNCRRAVELDPRDATAQSSLGNALRAGGDLQGALGCYRRAVELNPRSAKAHTNLGVALKETGDVAAALRCYRKALELDPRLPQAHSNLGNALYEQGDMAGAIHHLQKAADFNPRDAGVRYGLGNALYNHGDAEGAIRCYRAAIELNPRHAYAHGALGQALLSRGEFAEACRLTRRGMDLLPPGHAMRGTYTAQLRQCETALALEEKLPDFLRGKARPANAAEALALAAVCRTFKHQCYAAAVRFYADAFAAEPKILTDMQHRYDAACCAALAGCGRGHDADKLEPAGRASLRQQALGWLRADLDAWGKHLAGVPPSGRQEVLKSLRHWQEDADVAGVRGEPALAALPPQERDAWRKLWADVAELAHKAGQPR
jgi:tetratricopeptide (TPR) repeat protein